jgi:hypothetical protein
MKKYNIEGGIDFFSELYKSLEDEENKFKTEDDNNLCLITNQPLTDKFVKMECGHKFNYIPLFNDLVNHKKKFNNMEGTATHLKNNEIRCPYCRKKTAEVLPYYEDLGLAKVNGVNYIDINNVSDSYYNGIYKHKLCEFIKPNVFFNPESKNITEFYKQGLNIEDCKSIKCNYLGTQLSYYHHDYNDEKFYCHQHKTIVVKKYKKEIADNIKEEKEKIKQKEKEEKQQSKQKEKEEKQKAKDELKKAVKLAKMNKNQKTKDINVSIDNIITDNVVIGISNVIISEDIQLCTEILKTGPKKGLQCGTKIFQNNLCKRHYNLHT